MRSLARARLVGALALILLSLVPWTAQAGTADDPEVTDPADDTDIQGVFPLGVLPIVSPGVDLRKGWVEENATHLMLSIGLEGSVTSLSPVATYDYTFNLANGATTYVAGAHWAGSFAPTGITQAVAASGTTLTLTVTKESVGAFRGDALGGFFLTSHGTLVTDPLASDLDRAPDSGTSDRNYTVSQGLARGGTASDTDGDGLADAKETTYFGNISRQDGRGDPDGDGLNNTREFALGTDPTKVDTDGDGLSDGLDSAPLDPAAPRDSDGDGLNDSWERKHFGTIDAQDDEGDPDADGLHNHEELELGTDPNKADTDGDGVTDEADSDPLDPTVANAVAAEATRQVKPELYGGAALFAIAATFILLGLAKGI